MKVLKDHVQFLAQIQQLPSCIDKERNMALKHLSRHSPSKRGTAAVFTYLLDCLLVNKEVSSICLPLFLFANRVYHSCRGA